VRLTDGDNLLLDNGLNLSNGSESIIESLEAGDGASNGRAHGEGGEGKGLELHLDD
jgi:hypothetical protein